MFSNQTGELQLSPHPTLSGQFYQAPGPLPNARSKTKSTKDRKDQSGRSRAVPHTFHFASSFGGSKDFPTILCPPASSYRNCESQGSFPPAPQIAIWFWVSIPSQSDLELPPPNSEGTPPLPCPNYLELSFPLSGSTSLAFSSPHIKHRRGFSKTGGLFYFLWPWKLLSQAIISYPKKTLVKWKT